MKRCFPLLDTSGYYFVSNSTFLSDDGISELNLIGSVRLISEELSCWIGAISSGVLSMAYWVRWVPLHEMNTAELRPWRNRVDGPWPKPIKDSITLISLLWFAFDSNWARFQQLEFEEVITIAVRTRLEIDSKRVCTRFDQHVKHRRYLNVTWKLLFLPLFI